MLTVTPLAMWHCGVQAGSVGSSFAERVESSIAGSKLVAVDMALQVGVKLASLVVVDPA